MSQMKFVCSNFNPTTPAPCSYEVVDEESVVIGIATDHEVIEHGYQDTPALRQQIKDSLVSP